ncbi:MAG: hypothetical protein OSJ45_14700 [Lachnospiraceae bacterium]|nr:hypothetical protein [Lachnospiraceae bacterium]
MKHKASQRKSKRIVPVFLLMVFLGGIIILSLILITKGIKNWARKQKNPEQVLQQAILAYMDCISEKRYGDMYGMLAAESMEAISEKDFIARNSAIYEGIGMENMKITITGYNKEKLTVTYNTSFDTDAGNISFGNEASYSLSDL